MINGYGNTLGRLSLNLYSGKSCIIHRRQPFDVSAFSHADIPGHCASLAGFVFAAYAARRQELTGGFCQVTRYARDSLPLDPAGEHDRYWNNSPAK